MRDIFCFQSQPINVVNGKTFKGRGKVQKVEKNVKRTEEMKARREEMTEGKNEERMEERNVRKIILYQSSCRICRYL